MSRRDLLTSRGWLKTGANAFVVASKTHSHLDPFIEFLKATKGNKKTPATYRTCSKFMENLRRITQKSFSMAFGSDSGASLDILGAWRRYGVIMESSWKGFGSVLEPPGNRHGAAWGRLCGDLWAILSAAAVSMGLRKWPSSAKPRAGRQILL